MMLRYRFELLAVVIGIFVITGSYMVGRSLGTIGEHDPCPGEMQFVSACWVSYYTAHARDEGSIAALHDLRRRYGGGGYARTFCHPSLHVIGAAAAKEFGSVAEAYTHGDTFCRAGYYHGVLEGLFGDADEGGAEQLLASLDAVCAAIPGKEQYSYDYFACVHGIGHGLMAYFDHDLFLSLSGCRTLSGDWERGSCYGGAFMENVTSHSAEQPSKFLKDDDPLYPCTVVGDEYRPYCYQMQTSHMLTLFNGDFERTFAACRGVEKKYRNTCFDSLGRDASGWSYGRADTARAYCDIGETSEERGHCLLGAAVDYIQSVGHAEARSLCRSASLYEQAICMPSVEWQLRAL